MKTKVLVVVPDRTRQAHLKKILPGVLLKLKRQGFKAEEIEILVALGLHDPMSRLQLEEMLGRNIVNKYTVNNHSQKAGALAYLGQSRKGVPVYLNKKLLAAEMVVTIGVVEPHLYAGYSGGIKTVAIGLAGDKTISFTHHPRFLDDRATALGNVRQNPFQRTLWEIAARLPVKYSVNVVNDSRGRLLRTFTGQPLLVHKQAVRFADRLYRKTLAETFEVMIATVGQQKGGNIYQASRAYNYLLNVPRPVVEKNGYVIVQAAIPEGFGRGLGEQRFGRILGKIKNVNSFIQKIKSGGCRAGEHRAYMVAKARQKAKLIFVSPRAESLLRGTLIRGFSSLSAALKQIKKELGHRPSIYRSRAVFNTILSTKN